MIKNLLKQFARKAPIGVQIILAITLVSSLVCAIRLLSESYSNGFALLGAAASLLTAGQSWLRAAAVARSRMSGVDQDTIKLNHRFQAVWRAFRCLMSKDACNALVGDLEERFGLESKKSIPKAHLWYWSQVFRSLVPIAWAALVRKIQGVSIRTRL
jgi:hypothetical protein